MTLKSLILLVISAVLVSSLAVGAILTYAQAQRRVAVEMDAALEAAERTVQRAVSDLTQSANPGLDVKRLIRSFDGSRHLVVSLVDDKDAAVDASVLARPDNDIPDWFFRLLETPPNPADVALPESVRPFRTLRLATDSRSEVDEIWGETLIDLATLLMFCTLVLALITFTLGRVLRPLSELSRAFERIGQGDYAPRVGEQGPAELRHLAQGFNTMASRLATMEGMNIRLNEQLQTVQDEERADLARDLHDEVSPLLFSVDVDTQSVRQLAESGDAPAIQSRADAIAEAVGLIKKHVRSILGRLRPGVSLSLGLGDAVDNLVAFWKTRRPSVDFGVDVPRPGWTPEIDQVIHAVIREALSNALKHTDPKRVDITVWQAADGLIRVEVKDDGGGLRTTGSSGGYGLLGMRERVGAIGGKLLVENRRDGAGVVVSASLPIPSDTALNPLAREVALS